MNKKLYCFLAICLLGTSVLAERSKTKIALDEITKTMSSQYYGAIFEELDKNIIPVTQVPLKCKNYSMLWIKKIMKTKWLPLDVEANLVAYKDVLFNERKDSNGVVFSKWEGDVLSLKYQINGIDFRVNELGSSITIMITYPNKLNLSNNSTKVVSKELRKYLNLPKEWTPNLTMKTKEAFYLSEFKKKDFSKSYWWETIRVFGGSDFLFLIIAENDGTPIKIRNHPGLDDRF